METTQVNLGDFPEDLKEDLVAIAKHEHRSLKAQIVYVLDQYRSEHPFISFKRSIEKQKKPQ